MLLYLTNLNLTKALTEDAPKSNNESDAQTLITMDAWKNSNYLCWNYVMNNLADSLYDMYNLKKNS